ncbi:MAG: peptide ABC transporter substrate-binding protein [Actinobacteria bacterium]|nr:peptide ABC transporter substrate-binding protein [Actinomycetota bacterium]
MNRTSQRSWSARTAIVATVLAIVAAACGGSSSSSKKPSTAGSTTSVNVPNGGTLTIGAEQEPDCADWIDSCAGTSWGTWTMEAQTMPRAFDMVSDNGDWVYRPSILLQGEPTLQTTPQQVVTYKINPAAKWSDGVPITSADFKYTWDQIAHGQNIYDTTGYRNISSVDTPDPATAVVTFSASYGGWKGLFGGEYGVFPSHILQGKDRDSLMKDGYTWSGGPWLIQSWQKGTSVTLVPNPNYWGEKAHLDKVIFQFVPDTASEFQAFRTGQVQAIYPQPQPDAVAAIQAGLPDSNATYTADTANLEALWFNNTKFPFDSKAVRQAVGYAIDRNAVVQRLFGSLGVKTAMNTLDPPILKQFTDTNAWSQYKLDLSKVDSLMTADGWVKGSNGIWAKGGKTADIEMKTTADNKRRELTEQIIQDQLKAAGFNVTTNNQKAGDLFGTQLPAGDFTVGLYADVATQLDPQNCALFCSGNIPTAANGNTGQNWQRVNIPPIDPLLTTVDTALDQSTRATADQQAMKILADNNVALPIDPLPNILLWSKRIVGDVSDNPIFSMFWNMNTWGLK